MDFFGWGVPPGVFGFVILLVLIGSVTSWLKTRAEQATLREAIRAGQPIDPHLLASLQDSPKRTREGLRIGGFVTIAVAIALVGFGFLLERASGDDQILLVMSGVALFPGLVGVALLLASATMRSSD